MAKITEYTQQGAIERQVLIGMIVNKEVLAMIATKWQNGMFGSKWANLVGRWCVNYFNNYGKAPNKNIETVFQAWVNEKERDDDTVNLVDRFLTTLSDEYKAHRREIDPQFVLDQANEHFDRIKLINLQQELDEKIELGELDEARSLATSFKPTDLGNGVGYDLLNDKERLFKAFEKKTEPIIYYPGALGEFFGDVFERDGFISFEGPEKRGKSFYLFDVVWRAMISKLRVALFSVGDMSEEQVNRRFAIRASIRPLKAKSIKYPLAIIHNEDSDTVDVETEDRNYKYPLNKHKAWKRFQKWVRAINTEQPSVRVSVHPNRTISAAGINGIIELWKNEGWIPDVVVIDYADILAPIDPKQNKIDQIDETWGYLRRMSQELHACVVTATQTNKESYKADTIGMQHFTNNKMKRAHVTASFGINQTETEKQNGIYRLSPVVLREEENISKVVYVASCLSIGNPCVRSCL